MANADKSTHNMALILDDLKKLGVQCHRAIIATAAYSVFSAVKCLWMVHASNRRTLPATMQWRVHAGVHDWKTEPGDTAGKGEKTGRTEIMTRPADRTREK